MTIPTVRLPGSPNARAFGTTDSLGNPMPRGSVSTVVMMKAAMAHGKLPVPRTTPLPTRADIARLRRDLDDAPDDFAKSQASQRLDVALLKAAMAGTETLPPGVSARSPLDIRERLDDEAHAIPRFDPRKYAPSVDGIKACGVQRTTPTPGGVPYLANPETDHTGLTGARNRVEQGEIAKSAARAARKRRAAELVKQIPTITYERPDGSRYSIPVSVRIGV